MLDKHDLLWSSLQRLDDDVTAGDGGSGVSSVIVGKVTVLVMEPMEPTVSVF